MACATRIAGAVMASAAAIVAVMAKYVMTPIQSAAAGMGADISVIITNSAVAVHAANLTNASTATVTAIPANLTATLPTGVNSVWTVAVNLCATLTILNTAVMVHAATVKTVKYAKMVAAL